LTTGDALAGETTGAISDATLQDAFLTTGDALAGETTGAISDATLQGTLLLTIDTLVGVRSIEWVCCRVR